MLSYNWNKPAISKMFIYYIASVDIFKFKKDTFITKDSCIY